MTAARCLHRNDRMLDRYYRLKREIVASSIDDDEYARFENDTALPPGTDLRIVEPKHAWPPRPDTRLYYTVEVRGARYNVEADALDRAIG